MKFIIKIFISALAVMLLAYLLPGVHIKDGFMYALGVAFVIGLLNTIVRPLLVFFTLPATIFTLGLFLFVINAFIIIIADSFLGGFKVDNFWWALLFSLFLSAINHLTQRILAQNTSKKRIHANSDNKKTIFIEKD